MVDKVNAGAWMQRRRRRLLVAAAGLAVALLALAVVQQVRTAWNIGVAYRYALPLYEVMRLRYATVFDPSNPHRVPLNHLAHRRSLAGPQDRLVTMPNNDTLYSLAVLDLSSGPVRLEVPDSGGRYYSAALMDAYTNNFSIISRRTTGGHAASFLVSGPGWAQDNDPAGAQPIRAPTNTVLLLVRVLVDGQDDLAAAGAVQEGFRVSGPPLSSRGVAPPLAPQDDDAVNFVDVVNRALADNPPPRDNAPMLAQVERVGMVPGTGTLPPSLASKWRQDLPLAKKLLARAVSRPRRLIQGWSYAPPDTGHFGTDYDVRAAIALVGLLALPPEEAMYTSAWTDARGRAFDGSHRYRLRLPPGGVPVDGFWSLSLYSIEADGRAYFTDNPLHRYAIGDRTPGLKKNADGSIDLLIQHDSPGAAQQGNWLPAPDGPFRLVMRAYEPRLPLLKGEFRYPAIECLDR